MYAGITIENGSDEKCPDQVLEMLSHFEDPSKILLRIVIQPDTAMEDYAKVFLVTKGLCRRVLCVVDSSRVEGVSQPAYLELFKDAWDALGEYLTPEDLLECGNEVGGGSTDPLALSKALAVVQWVKDSEIPLKLLLTGYAVPDYLPYLSTIPAETRALFDWLLISDYPLDGMYSPQLIDWLALNKLFPNAKLGIGECGILHHGDPTPDKFTHTYPTPMVLGTMDNFASLRSACPDFKISIFWWYGTQHFLKAKGPLFTEFVKIVNGLPGGNPNLGSKK